MTPNTLFERSPCGPLYWPGFVIYLRSSFAVLQYILLDGLCSVVPKIVTLKSVTSEEESSRRHFICHTPALAENSARPRTCCPLPRHALPRHALNSSSEYAPLARDTTAAARPSRQSTGTASTTVYASTVHGVSTPRGPVAPHLGASTPRSAAGTIQYAPAVSE